MEYRANINGIMVDATYSEESIRDIYIPLLKRVQDMQAAKGARVLVMVAAAPGAGKSTLLSFLQELSVSTEGLKPITIIGMDGFHRYQDYLLKYTTIRDGKEIPMVQVKGAPETFDLPRLQAFVQRVASGENCGWPQYDRMSHNPVEDAIWVEGDIVFLEGNYLLLDQEGWRELSTYADYTIRLDAELEILRKRLVERKLKSGSGTDYEAAVEFVERSDLYNAKLCLNHSLEADLVIPIEV